MNIRLILQTASICIFTIISCVYPLQSMGYELTDLGTLDGTFSTGEDINANGHVTGTSDIANGETRAFLYMGTSMQDLGKLDVTHTGSNANGINDSDHVTGTSSLTPAYSPVYRAFLYSNGVMQDLGITSSRGHDINNSGQIAGWFVWLDSSGCCSSGYSHAFFHDGNTVHDLGTLADNQTSDGVDSFGYAVNNSGWVTGLSETDSSSNASPEHAFIYDGNNMRDIGTLGGTNSVGYDINDNGQVTGYSDITGDIANHAFLYSGNTMRDLGTLGGENSAGYGINNSGYIVGRSQLANGEYAAFLYNGNSMLDLCVLTDCTANGWTNLSDAKAINDSGEITGSGEINGETHAYIISGVSISAVPIAFNDNVNIEADTTKDINVIANDTDIEDGSPPLAPPAVVAPTTATSTQGFAISANANGMITYTPTGGFTGNDSFKYTLTDSDGQVSAPATVFITVSAAPVFATPVAINDIASVKVDTAKDINVIANDTDVEDGSPPLAPPAVVTPTTATSTQGFAISANANGMITYTPTGGFTGTDDFRYTLTDSDGQISAPATVSITVATNPVYIAPIANNDNVSVKVDTAKDINVIANDTDFEDGSPPAAPPAVVTPTTATSTQGFAISANANGTITYTPMAGFTGTDYFKYTLTDSDDQVSTQATVTITVSADTVFVAPVANDDDVSVVVDTTKDINVITNDTDLEDGSPPLAPPAVVTPTTATSTQGFTISANSNGTITYTPTGGFTGVDYFNYTLTDSDGEVSAPATVNITVTSDPASTVDTTDNSGGGLVFNLFYLMMIFGWLAIYRYKH